MMPAAPRGGMIDRLARNWVYGGFLAGVMLFALLPLLAGAISWALLLTIAQLPLYMLHQFEEHDADRFRRFVNAQIGHGQEVLSPRAVCVINIGGVWAVDVVAIWLAATAGIGFGLIAIYGVLVNAVVHIAAGLVLRRYNPGLVTSIVLFLPVGGAALWDVQQTGQATPLQHAIGLGAALLIHAAIIAWVRRPR